MKGKPVFNPANAAMVREIHRCIGNNRTRPTRHRDGRRFPPPSRGGCAAAVARSQRGEVAGFVFFQRAAQRMTQGRFQFRVLFFHALLNPFREFRAVAFRKSFEGCFDFSNGAHGGKITQPTAICKALVSDSPQRRQAVKVGRGSPMRAGGAGLIPPRRSDLRDDRNDGAKRSRPASVSGVRLCGSRAAGSLCEKTLRIHQRVTSVRSESQSGDKYANSNLPKARQG